MVRRWSYLNIFTTIPTTSINKFYKKSKLILFKLNVKYKHFRKFKLLFKTTKRRAYRHLKHTTTFLPLSNIFKFWTIDYKNLINISKFEYTYNIYFFNYLIYNANYLKNNNPDLHYNTNFLLSNINKKRNYICSRHQRAFLIQHKDFTIKENSLALLWHNENANDLNWILETNLYLLLFINFDLQYFAPFIDIAKNNFDFQIIFNTITSIFLTKILYYYTLLIIFFYSKILLN